MTDLTKQPLKGYDNLSTPTLFNDRNLHPIAKSFTTNILIVGGAYSGLSALRSLQLHLAEQIQRFKQAAIHTNKEIVTNYSRAKKWTFEHPWNPEIDCGFCICKDTIHSV